MTIDELKLACKDALASGREAIILVIPKGVRLCGRSGPVGELLCDAGRGSVVRFKAAAVLKFIEKQEAKQKGGAT